MSRNINIFLILLVCTGTSLLVAFEKRFSIYDCTIYEKEPLDLRACLWREEHLRVSPNFQNLKTDYALHSRPSQKTTLQYEKLTLAAIMS